MTTLSRRAVLKGLGVTAALPFLDAMAAPGRTLAAGAPRKLRLVCVEMVHGAAGSSSIDSERPLGAGRRWPRFRPRPNQPEVARALSRSAHHPQQHRRGSGRAVHGAGDRRRSRAVERGIPDAGAPEADAGQRRAGGRLAGSDVRPPVRPGHADSVDAAVHRGRRSSGRMRLWLLLRLYRHHQLGVADAAAADDSQPAGRLRSALRRVRQRCDAGRAPERRGGPASSITARVGRASASTWARRTASPLPRQRARSSGGSRSSKRSPSAASCVSSPKRRQACQIRFPSTCG